MRATLAHANIDAIVNGLTNTYAFMHMNDPSRHQQQQGQAGRCCFQRRSSCGPGAPQGARVDVVTYALYTCMAECAEGMADAWEDTAGCARPDCLHENILRC